VLRRRSVECLTNLCSGSQIFDKSMCHVCHDVCGVCGEARQVGHCEDKNHFVELNKLSIYPTLPRWPPR